MILFFDCFSQRGLYPFVTLTVGRVCPLKYPECTRKKIDMQFGLEIDILAPNEIVKVRFCSF